MRLFFLATCHHVHKFTVLFPWLQIIEHLKTESLTYVRSADSWVLGLLFLKRETWHNQSVCYIKQFVFRVAKSIAEGGRYVYRRLNDTLIGLNLTT
jgi:hypothetical protein